MQNYPLVSPLDPSPGEGKSTFSPSSSTRCDERKDALLTVLAKIQDEYERLGLDATGITEMFLAALAQTKTNE